VATPLLAGSRASGGGLPPAPGEVAGPHEEADLLRAASYQQDVAEPSGKPGAGVLGSGPFVSEK
jgi:hypothetical protein